MFGALLAALFLAVASMGLTGNTWWLLTGSWEWIAAGVVAAIGLVLVATSLPGRRRGPNR